LKSRPKSGGGGGGGFGGKGVGSPPPEQNECKLIPKQKLAENERPVRHTRMHKPIPKKASRFIISPPMLMNS